MQPAKPVMDAEPIYEDHPVCFNAKDLGTSNSLDVRRSAYLDLFSVTHTVAMISGRCTVQKGKA